VVSRLAAAPPAEPDLSVIFEEMGVGGEDPGFVKALTHAVTVAPYDLEGFPDNLPRLSRFRWAPPWAITHRPFRAPEIPNCAKRHCSSVLEFAHFTPSGKSPWMKGGDFRM